MKNRFEFADIHCHPNLKTYGHSFERNSLKSDVWFTNPPTRFKKALSRIAGLTRFSQCDFNTMIQGNVRIAFASYYPFEKGFFHNPMIFDPIAAFLGNIVTGIGYNRIRHIQQHRDYFADLQKEHCFFAESCNRPSATFSGGVLNLADSIEHLSALLEDDRNVAVIPTIEGAHVFGTGLKQYGVVADQSIVQSNIEIVKNWRCPPLFITFAHNFDNELCGHAPSLERLKGRVDQSTNIGKGFTAFGEQVVHQLLSDTNRILIDVKHMSLVARNEYYNLINQNYREQIPVIVSHGAVTGTAFNGNRSCDDSFKFARDEINFFDEELLHIGRSSGLFGIQLDVGRLADRSVIKKNKWIMDPDKAVADSAAIVWNHIRHIAETLDRNGMYAWNTACVGSDFDGTINPLNGIWTSNDLPKLAEQLLLLVSNYLKKQNTLRIHENRMTTPEEVVHKFTIQNVMNFLGRNYKRHCHTTSSEMLNGNNQSPKVVV